MTDRKMTSKLHTISILLSAMAMTLSSCQKESGNLTSATDTSNILYISCSGKDSESKVELDNYFRLVWNESDSVSVFRSSTNEKYRFLGKTGDNIGSFGKVIDGKLPGDPLFGKNYGVFPYGNYSCPEEGVVSVTLGSTQKYVPNSFDTGANYMMSSSSSLEDNTLKMRNACGYLKIQMYGWDTINEVKITGNDNESLFGSASLSITPEGIPFINVSGTGKELTLDCGDGVYLGNDKASATPFYFVIPPVVFHNGFTLEITYNGTEKFIKSTTKSFEITRNSVLKFTAFEMTHGGAEAKLDSFGLSYGASQRSDAIDVLGPVITVCVPRGTDLTHLTADFDAGASQVYVGSTLQISGVTVNDFSLPVSYRVTSPTGNKVYTVKVIDVDLPVVYLSTREHVEIADKKNWVDSSMFKILKEDGTVIDYQATSVKGRGNASWTRPKKSYSIKFATKPSKLKPAIDDVLGMPPHKRWCLIAVQWGYFGNLLGYELARRTEHIAWEPSGKYVELVLNGQHWGTYLLVEQIKVDKERVNIKELTAKDTTAAKLSGGYLLTYDQTYDDPIKFRSTTYNMPVMVKSPDDDDYDQKQVDWIKSYINNMESVLKSEEDAHFSTREYADLLDISSVIDMWFVWEIAGKVGSYEGADFAAPRSVWYYKDRGGKLMAGPCWDIDSYLFSSQKLYCNKCQYYGSLFNDPVFVARVKEKWPVYRNELDGHGSSSSDMVQYLDSLYNRVEYSARRNKKLWTWTIFDLDNEYQTIRTGLPAKLNWMENDVINNL